MAAEITEDSILQELHRRWMTGTFPSNMASYITDLLLHHNDAGTVVDAVLKWARDCTGLNYVQGTLYDHMCLCAVTMGNVKLLRRLLALGLFDRHGNQRELWLRACVDKREDILDALHEANVRIDFGGTNRDLLEEAISASAPERLVVKLVRWGAEVTPETLKVAASRGLVSLLECMITTTQIRGNKVPATDWAVATVLKHRRSSTSDKVASMLVLLSPHVECLFRALDCKFTRSEDLKHWVIIGGFADDVEEDPDVAYVVEHCPRSAMLPQNGTMPIANHAVLLRYVLRRGLLGRESYSDIAYYAAGRTNDTRALEVAYSFGARASESDEDILSSACIRRGDEIVKFLVFCAPDAAEILKQWGSHAVRSCVELSSWKCLDHLLAAGARPNFRLAKASRMAKLAPAAPDVMYRILRAWPDLALFMHGKLPSQPSNDFDLWTCMFVSAAAQSWREGAVVDAAWWYLRVCFHNIECREIDDTVFAVAAFMCNRLVPGMEGAVLTNARAGLELRTMLEDARREDTEGRPYTQRTTRLSRLPWSVRRRLVETAMGVDAIAFLPE